MATVLVRSAVLNAVLCVLILAILPTHSQVLGDFVVGNSKLETTDVCSCECGIPSRRHRIVGGHVAELNEYPWIAALYKKGKFFCGGTLISRHHVLTAAHCLYGFSPLEIRVTLGEHDRNSTDESLTVERTVAAFYRHKNFSIFTFNNDIALLRLDKPVDFGATIRPACLPLTNEANYTDQMAIVTGWGRVEEKKPTSNTLRKVAVPIMSMEECRKAGYSTSKITDNMMCAGYRQGERDACQGDSGGPLHIAGDYGGMEVVGIVSWGRGCARPNFPGIYTRIANYLPWIQAHLNSDCLCKRPTIKSSDGKS